MFDNSSAPSTLRCADLIGGHLSAGLRPTSPFSVSDSSDGEQLDVIPFGVAGLRHRCQCLLSQDAISAKDLGTLLESSELLALGYDDIASQKDISYIREQLQAKRIDPTAMVRIILHELYKTTPNSANNQFFNNTIPSHLIFNSLNNC
jgi:hypothetical protein